MPSALAGDLGLQVILSTYVHVHVQYRAWYLFRYFLASRWFVSEEILTLRLNPSLKTGIAGSEAGARLSLLGDRDTLRAHGAYCFFFKKKRCLARMYLLDCLRLLRCQRTGVTRSGCWNSFLI